MMLRFVSSISRDPRPCPALGPGRTLLAIMLLHSLSSVTLVVLQVPQSMAETLPFDGQTRTERAAHITEASQRFGIPEVWIRAVMHRESAGDPRAVSPKGATGLMQIMPDTWAELRARYRFGPDPFDERDNILAGTAYLNEMHDRYGTVARMLAAYNAGPGRVDDLLQTSRPLPRETRAYIAAILSSIGGDAATDVSPVRPSDFRDAPIFVQRGAPPDADRTRPVDEGSFSNEAETAIESPAPFDADEISTGGFDSLLVRRGAEAWR